MIYSETGVSEENPHFHAGEHPTLSYTSTVDHGDRTRVARIEASALSTVKMDTLVTTK